jgi:hypothetical protein
MKQIKFSLSPTSIQQAIKEIQAYKQSLPAKCQLLVRALAEHGYNISHSVLAEHQFTGQTLASLRIEDMSSDKIRMAIVIEPSAILFLEFGSGVKYSATVNPKSAEFGYGVGTYPGQKNAFNPGGWWYLGDDGEYHHSYGIEAAMPMYKAEKAIIDDIGMIVKAVFK